MNVISAVDALHLNVKSDGFRVGQVLDGMVLEVSEDGIATVNLSGRTITVASGSEMLQMGETVRLKITGVAKGEVLATRVDLKETSLLNKLGVPVTAENLGYISELLAHRHAIDKMLLSTLSKNAQEVRMLHELLLNGADVDDVETPVREMVLRLLREGGSDLKAVSKTGVSTTAGSTSSALTTGATSAATTGTATGAPIPPNPTGMHTVASALTGPVSGAEVPNAATSVPLPANTLSASGGSNAVVASEQAPQILQAATDSLPTPDLNAADFPPESSSISYQHAASAEKILKDENMLKDTEAGRMEQDADANDPVLNPKQEAALKILSRHSDKSEFADAVKYILQHFDSHDNVALALQRKTLNLKNLAQIQFDVSDIAEEFIRVSRQSEKLDEILSIIRDLKQGNDFEHVIQSRFPKLRQVSEAVAEQTQQNIPGIYYISVPVRLLGEENRADMYFKRSPKNPSELSILVVLNTQTLGEVRCLVYKMDDEYSLGLALEDDEITDLVREKISGFRSGVGNIQIYIRSREEMERTFFEKKEASSYLDLRV